jgi:heat shock protein HslJ
MIQSLLLLITMVFLGCGLVQAGELPGIDLNQIVFLSGWTKSGKVHFSNGEYRERAAPGSATELIVKLTDQRTLGKLDGKEAGAVIVVTHPGGSGSFYDLVLLVKNPQGWINQTVAFLGDWIKIRSLAVTNDAIFVEMNTHGPGDAMCSPRRQVIQQFVLRDDRLIKMKEGIQGASDPLLTDTVWKWQQTLYSNDTRSLTPNPENYTLKLLPDGKVSIRADCNLGGGVYTLRESEISIEITHTTRAACPPESLEQDYIRDLNAAARYFVEGDILHVDLKGDIGMMKFMR